VLSDGCKEPFPVLPSLGLADAGDEEEALDAGRPPARHVSKRGVAEDDIGWNILLVRDVSSQSAQSIEQAPIDTVPRVGQRLLLGDFGRLEQPRSLLPAHGLPTAGSQLEHVELTSLGEIALADQLLDPVARQALGAI